MTEHDEKKKSRLDVIFEIDSHTKCLSDGTEHKVNNFMHIILCVRDDTAWFAFWVGYF